MSDAEAKRKAAIGEIDAEVARLRTIADEKAKARENDTQKHVLDQDWPLQKRLQAEIENINQALDDLLKRRNDIEINGIPEQRSVQPAPRAKGKWEIKSGLVEPQYPKGARVRGDKAALDAAMDRFVEFEIADSYKTFAEQGVDPNATVGMQTLALAVGQIHAGFAWNAGRFKEVEERCAEIEQLNSAVDTRLKTIEARPTKASLTKTLNRVTGHDRTGRIEAWEKVEGEDADIDLLTEMDQMRKRITDIEAKAMRYSGVWSEGTSYGIGAATTDKGSLWLCQRPTAERPGLSDAWKLVVKQGQVR